MYTPFRAALVASIENFKVGNGIERNIFIGPVQNKLQYSRVISFLDDIHDGGQRVATGGKVASTEMNGYFIQPTLVDNPPDDSKILVEEPFSPVVPLLKWSNKEEVIARVNDSETGLGASVWSKDLDHAVHIGEALDVGSVWINEHLGIKPTATSEGTRRVESVVNMATMGCEATVIHKLYFLITEIRIDMSSQQGSSKVFRK